MEKPQYQYVLLVDELAALLRTTPACIRQQVWLKRFRHLAGLPDPIQRRPLAWLKSDIERWLESRATFAQQPSQGAHPQPRRRPGRRRKEAA